MGSVLLTGGTGFIGSHTAAELLKNGIDTVLLDNLSNSDERVVYGIEKITGRRPKLYIGEASDSALLDRIFEENEIEAVIHFAGLKSVGESVKKPLVYYENNIATATATVQAMLRHGCKRFVFSSSATVYGASNRSPLSEDMKKGEPLNPYGRTKAIIEEILGDTVRAERELSVVILRYFNPVGADESGEIGEKPNGIPNNLMPYIMQVAAGIREKLFVFGNDYDTPDGTGVRDYIHVSDLASGHFAALRRTKEMKGLEIFNLGTGRGTSVLELLSCFERVNNIKIPYEIAGRREGDAAVCYAEVGKAKELLHWSATRTLEDMCRDSYNFQCRIRD